MRILIFGAGNLGKSYFRHVKKMNNDVAVLAVVDNNSEMIGSYIDYVPVISSEQIKDFVYDKIYICVSLRKTIVKILNQLKELGVSEDKIEVLVDSAEFSLYNEESDFRIIWLRNLAQYMYQRNFSGNVAECGVYRGHFAQFINKYFYDKKLYLFDTFEGFPEENIQVEMNLDKSYFEENVGVSKNREEVFEEGEFKDTCVEEVMGRMPYSDNCIIKQGIFPETAVDTQDLFCFVNLDMDLYQPTLAGLDFFWNKMVDGGVILIHDYFNKDWPGVVKAVADFEKEHNQAVAKITIGDFSSIALIKV